MALACHLRHVLAPRIPLLEEKSQFLSGFRLSSRPNLKLCARGPHARPDFRCGLLDTAKPQGQSRKGGPGGLSGGVLPESLEREAHKHFDQVVITVRAGDGGNGAVFKLARPSAPGYSPGKAGKRVMEKRKTEKKKPDRKGLKRGPDGSVLLPMGGHGGDVLLVADPGVATLLPLHKARRYSAHRGSNVDVEDGLSKQQRDGLPAPPLRISVPVGTVVKRKRGAKLLMDLAHPGDECLVARGGRGGISVMQIPANNAGHLRPVKVPNGATVTTDTGDKALTIGLPGEEVALELTLRVVADVGLVGFPNAGKSSLLAAVTAAKPEIADYPFTTLMPNLGRISGDPSAADGGLELGATLADLPGLIEGAHVGRGLGRMFLRHLRRTRLLLHVVDAAGPSPLEDYITLREELRLYNPQYTKRPHIVVLNKLDLPKAAESWEMLQEQILGLTGPCVGNPVVDSNYRMDQGGVSDEVATSTSREHDLSETDDGDGSPGRVHREPEADMESGAGEGRMPLLPEEVGVEGLGSRRGGTGSENARSSSDRSSSSPEGGDQENVWVVPVAVVGISARTGTGIKPLLDAIRRVIEADDSHGARQELEQNRSQRIKAPQWRI